MKLFLNEALLGLHGGDALMVAAVVLTKPAEPKGAADTKRRETPKG